MFIVKYNFNGDVLWTKVLSSGGDDVNAIATDNKGYTYIAGDFQGPTFIIGLDSFSRPASEFFFVAKLDTCTHSFTTLNITACYGYILNSISYTASGIYRQHLPSIHGCDSVITLNLTVTVVITANGCTDTSSCYTINDLVISENISGRRINIYPNPTTSYFTITSSEKIKEIKVFDVLGCEILKQVQNDQSATIDVSGIAKGIYFVEIKTERGIVRKKMVKE